MRERRRSWRGAGGLVGGCVVAAVRVIAGVTLVTALGLILGNPTYVEPYTSALGQVVLATICGCWGAALWWLNQMSRFASPERFLLPRTVEGAAR